MWNNPEEAHGLDPKASNSIFGKGVGNEVGRIHQTIRPKADAREKTDGAEKKICRGADGHRRMGHACSRASSCYDT
eukprot:600352-Pyramimonas_sp.AAC.2